METALGLESAVGAWESTVTALVALGHGCRDEDFDRPTDCPGWTVKDQFSHVIGIERTLLGEPEPDPGSIQDLPTEHVRNDLGRRNEVAVHLWRPVPGPEVVAELEQGASPTPDRSA